LGKILVAAFLVTHLRLIALVVFRLVSSSIDFASALYVSIILRRRGNT
jgi:hypothetical protein